MQHLAGVSHRHQRVIAQHAGGPYAAPCLAVPHTSHTVESKSTVISATYRPRTRVLHIDRKNDPAVDGATTAKGSTVGSTRHWDSTCHPPGRTVSYDVVEATHRHARRFPLIRTSQEVLLTWPE